MYKSGINLIELRDNEIYYSPPRMGYSWQTTVFKYHIDSEIYDILKNYFFIPHSFIDLPEKNSIKCTETIKLVPKKVYNMKQLFSKLKLILP